MYTLKSIAQRSTMLGAAAALVVAAVIPAATVLADALNPLTERSLLLTSSAPGYVDTDGSGNSEGSPNSVGTNYAPAGSGPNGKKSGQTFTFTHTSDATVKGFSLQYCTSAAGLCQAPGNNNKANPTYTSGVTLPDMPGDADTPGDFRNGGNFVTGTNEAGRHTNAQAHPLGFSDLDFVGTWAEGTAAGGVGPLALKMSDLAGGQYRVSVNGEASDGWALTAGNLEDDAHTKALTGKNNYITLTNTTGEAIVSGDEVQVFFKPSETTYITNPGADEFFVKINTYSSDTELYGPHNEDGVNNEGEEDHTVIDGGVTVANVMTDSIHITTKVLETMSFSVGTENRDTKDIGNGQTHGKCDPILTSNNNRLNLGNPNAEYSLETGKAWDAYSYWRLSSNSSGGASVYYSGDTLRNTVGDFIADMPAKTASTPGTEQFGLGFVSPGFHADPQNPDPAKPWLDIKDDGAATWAAGYLSPSSYPFVTTNGQQLLTEVDSGDGRDFTALAAQTAAANYNAAEGTIDNGSAGAGTAQFRFVATSQTIPELIAQQNETVISCSTAKMRYVGNIGADTPAGVYTTKINYLAAPQY